MLASISISALREKGRGGEKIVLLRGENDRAVGCSLLLSPESFSSTSILRSPPRRRRCRAEVESHQLLARSFVSDFSLTSRFRADGGRLRRLISLLHTHCSLLSVARCSRSRAAVKSGDPSRGASLATFLGFSRSADDAGTALRHSGTLLSRLRRRSRSPLRFRLLPLRPPHRRFLCPTQLSLPPFSELIKARPVLPLLGAARRRTATTSQEELKQDSSEDQQNSEQAFLPTSTTPCARPLRLRPRPPTPSRVLRLRFSSSISTPDGTSLDPPPHPSSATPPNITPRPCLSE